MPMIVIDDDLVTKEFKSSPFAIVPLDRMLETISRQQLVRRSGKCGRTR
jgi:hypothetical protein